MKRIAAAVSALVVSIVVAGAAAEPAGQAMFQRDTILRLMHRVNDWQVEHPVMKPLDRNWERGTWYTGVMAAWKATGDDRFMKQAVDWGVLHQWQVGTEGCGANKLFCVETWAEIYLLSKKKDLAQLQPAVKWLDTPAKNSPAGAGQWYLEGDHCYADSLYGAPALAMLAKATGETKYLDIMHKFFWDITGEILDKEDRLYYRDRRFIGKASKNGKKVYWSRGNGWVYGGLVRVLEYLPADDPQRARYVELFRQMTAQLVRRQGADGLWRPNLDDAEELPMPETSGTGFFCYGMAWGINHGLLERETVLPAVRRAWLGLASAVGADGRVRWGQPVGDRPSTLKEEQTHEYVTGTFLLAAAEVYRLADAFAAKAVVPCGPPVMPLSEPIRLSGTFQRLKAPGTGRVAVQLTTGAATCYPLYYFAPTMTKDCRYLVYHRYLEGNVQLWRLNLQTAESVQLTHADAAEADWRPWQKESGLRGVYDYRSAINQARETVIYFDGNKAREVNLDTLKDEPLFDVPADREVQGQNCCSPDGKWFVYIHRPIGSQYGQPCNGALVVGYNFETKEQRTLCSVNHAIHHVTMYDNEHFFAHHPPGHNGMCFTDLSSGKWTDLRYGDPGVKGAPCHSIATAQGIAYEVFGSGKTVVSGLYDPFTRARFEFPLPADFGYSHTGWDPSGRLWFWETTGKPGHSLWYLENLECGKDGVFKPLTGDWKTFSARQRGHFHPQVTPDHRWILFTAGDQAARVDHIFLLDISDLRDTAGVTVERLSHTGANDLTVAGGGLKEQALAAMRRVADWQLNQPGKYPAGDWIMGPFWNGLMALGRLPGSEGYIQKVADLGVKEEWRVIQTHWQANDHCTPQSYLELYELRRDPAMLAPTVKALDAYLAAAEGADNNLDFVAKNRRKWSWCDALYMSPPAFARLAKVTGDSRYTEYLHRWWWLASEYYYDKEEKLFYRDQTMFNAREKNGRKVFWSRGNGWVVGGLVRVLQYLSKDDPVRVRYELQFREMCGALRQIQCADGLWRSGLLDADAYPEPESSGSAFFVYALAYGVNAGLLDRTVYEPAVLRGWSGLVGCVTAEGRFRNVQPVGDRPCRFQPDTSLPYGSGAFLLAGSEVYSLLKH